MFWWVRHLFGIQTELKGKSLFKIRYFDAFPIFGVEKLFGKCGNQKIKSFEKILLLLNSYIFALPFSLISISVIEAEEISHITINGT